MLTGLFQWGIRQLTELENQMTSVERILDYDTIELEDLNNDSKNVLNQNWPKNGKIQFANVSLSYFPDAKPVLKNVSFEIAPLQKVGVVGRTGAGKSSLINAFLRLADIEGTILIDDVDTKSISLQQLRSKLSIIPQEPVLFSGSLRNNLDPFHEYTDDILWDAIEKVEMKDTIAASISGLDMEIFEGGSNLSVGQRQLLCLARALLCKNVILVLDEATANVDHLTDVLIQNTIRKQFTSCTVVVISHRLDNVIDCDKILVIDAGELVEFGYPYELLQNVGGVFYKMVEQTGNVKLRNFTHIARSCFGFDYVCIALCILCNEILIKPMQILSLGQLVDFFITETEDSDKNDAYFYAAKLVVFALVAVIIEQPMVMGGYHLGIKMRIACCSLIYRKAIKLSKAAFDMTTTGQMVNLISNDLKHFERFSLLSMFIWIGPLETIFLSYFMYKEVGYSSIIGIMFIFVFIPLHFYMGKFLSRYREKSASRTDERIRLMNEIVTSISVIKMQTWEKAFVKLISLYRKLEMKAIQKSAYLSRIYSACAGLNSRIALFITILSYVLANNQINAKQVFVLTGFYNLLKQAMATFFPIGISLTAETNVCLKRITNFLLLEETLMVSQKIDIQDDAISLKNVSARWNKQSQHALQNINLNIAVGKLTAIIGPVGSGKSSLLNIILREMPVVDGEILINGEISYSTQESWLFHDSVQQNILFGSNLNHQRYRDVVNACSLQTDFQHFAYADSTMVKERGASLSGGQRARINLARAVYKNADIYLLDDPLSAVDAQVGKEIFENCIRNYLKGKTVVLVTHQLQYLANVDHIVVLDKGLVIAQGSCSDLQKSGVDFTKYLSPEVVEPEEINFTEKEDNLKVSVSKNVVKQTAEPRESRSSGSVSGSVYKKYIRCGGNYLILGGIVASFISVQVLLSGSDYFLAHWVNIEQKDQKNRNDESDRLRHVYLTVYSGLIVVLILMSVVRAIVYTISCINASVELHNKMFLNVIRAPLQFFLSNPSGRILNRFSKDIGAIDELLPMNIMDTVSVGFLVLGVVVVTSIVNAWLILPAVLTGIIFYFIRVIYIGTSRSVKRLEGVTKSPMIEHLNLTLQGLATIRAAGAQKFLIDEFDNRHDLNTCASYLFWATAKAFGFWLDLFCVVYMAAVTLSALLSDSEKLGGNVGLIISQTLMLTQLFQYGMRQVTEMENQMTSVERILEYDNIKLEELNENSKNVDHKWPENGKIQFINLSLSYFKDTPHVLKNVSLQISPLQKVGVVGRTGAGKTSLIYALFRLADIEGTILIDDVDTKNVGLSQLRSKISVIPQEPVLFSGSLRNNLDPFEEYTDDVLWDALEKVALKDLFSGLDSEVSEGGSNFSVGQRQLLCLARTILRKNKILILDEATANVDHRTDALIHNTIRNQFTSCTVVVIAHRLETIIDSEKILVMDSGQAVEFDDPYVLLQNVDGVFFKMVDGTGKTNSRTLTDIAKTNYYRRHAKDISINNKQGDLDSSSRDGRFERTISQIIK
ncbi:hypothetical protein FQR65_LT12641 [Abscondita terminalis]|nr:hypothetical protein FQR65_LT12641 [Abscondita terminalis]